MGGSKKQTVGYRYFLGLHKALCHGPIDKVLKIRVDEKVAWEGDNDGSTSIYIDKPSLFGGDPPEGEGGVRGWVDVDFGGPNQGMNSYLQEVLGAVIPAFRGICCAVLRRPMIGNSPYLKNWGWTLQRIMTTGSQGEAQWYSARAKIGEYDMNPAHIVRECITNRDWGMGSDVSAVNDANFRAVADTLFNEGFGLSVMWDRQKPLNEFLTDMMEHVDGVLYVNRTNGLFEINLIRDNYNPDDLPVLDEYEIIEVTDYTRPLVGDLTSQVTVQYWDRETMTDASTTVQDIALSRQQGAAIAVTKQYPAITDPDLANRVAMRDLKTVSTPLIGCTIKCNRRIAEGLIMGSVFKMSWPRLAIEEITMRVVEIDYGTETNPEITLNIVQDIFGLGDAVYAPNPPSEWEPPVSVPTPPPARLFTAAPYRELVQVLGQAEVDTLTPTDEYLMATAVKPSNDSLSVEWWNDSGSGGDFELKADIDFSPYGLLSHDISYLATVVQLTSTRDLERITNGTLAAIGEELVRVDSVNALTGEVTISRGVADSLPLEHASGSAIIVFDEYADTELVRYTGSDTVRSQLLTKTIQGTLDPSDAPIDTTNLFRRQTKPYPAGNVRLNTEYYPATFTGDITLSWAHRDRVLQADILYDFTAGSIGPEAATTYTISIYGDGSLLKTFAGETGTSVTYTADEEIADHGTLATAYRFTLATVRGSEAALRTFEMLSERTIPLEILEHPEDQFVSIGSQATFSSRAIGWEDVQWYRSIDGGTDWEAISGAEEPDYVTGITDGSEDGYMYRAEYRNQTETAATNPATLTIADGAVPFDILIEYYPTNYGYEKNLFGGVSGDWFDGTPVWFTMCNTGGRFTASGDSRSPYQGRTVVTFQLTDENSASVSVVATWAGQWYEATGATDLAAFMQANEAKWVSVTILEPFAVVKLGSRNNDYYGLATDISSHTGEVVEGGIWPDDGREMTHFYEDNSSISRFGFYSSTPEFNGWPYLDITTIAENGDSITIPWRRAGSAYVTVNSLQWRNWARDHDGMEVEVYVTEGSSLLSTADERP